MFSLPFMQHYVSMIDAMAQIDNPTLIVQYTHLREYDSVLTDAITSEFLR